MAGAVYAGILIEKKQSLNRFGNLETPPSELKEDSTLNNVSPTPDITTDWKTYTNEKYSFEFKYPNLTNWTIKEDIQGENSVGIYNYDINKAPGRGYSPEKDSNLFKIEITFDQKFSDVEKWLEQEKKRTDPITDQSVKLLNIKTITVDGQNGVYFEEKDSLSGTLVGGVTFQTPQKQLAHFFGGLNYEGNKELFDQILSTFRFE